MFAFCSNIECSEECWLIWNYDLRVDMPDSCMPTVKIVNVEKLKILEELNFVFLFLPSKEMLMIFLQILRVFFPNERF